MFPRAASAQLSEADIVALQKRGAEEGWTFTVNQNPATRYSLDQLCGLVMPKEWQEGAQFDPCTPRRALPSSYNWCTEVGCPTVRNQGGCGSCWAFGTVGALECNILIQDGVEVNLSEQWLVSCNREGWGCGGGWWAHDYHEWKWDACNGFGAVMEADFPYVGWDAPCNCPYPHEYFIDGWAYIGTPWTVPSVEAIKQAILDYGPVSVGVAVDGAFQAYGGGVFNACSASTINHAVVLVGWDDNQGPGGVWYLRNSWGSGWGEGGYMRIPYGCDYVGYNATYVQYMGDASVKTCELNVLEPPEPQSEAEFGNAVAADGLVAVVGAHQNSCGAGSQCGAAYVYRWSGTSWDEEQKITASDAAAGDQFGGAVAVSGDAAIVGAPKDDRGAQADAGSAYVFRYTGGAWVEEQQLTATVAAAGAEFGTAVALQGDVALVGAPYETGGGSVYVFRYAGGTWGLEATLTAAGAGDGFGTSVSLSNDVAMVGAPSVDCGAGSDCGAAYVYRYSGGTWSAEQTLTASDAQSLDWFGAAVAVDGAQAAVGAPLADCGAGSNCGAVYMFDHGGTDWTELEKISTQDRAVGNYVGWSVAIREGVGLVGAFGLDCDEGTNCGAAYFLRYVDGDWSPDGKLVASDIDAGNSYGSSVALGNCAALIGAKTRYYPAIAHAGGAYAYAFPVDCNENGDADVCDVVSGYSEDADGNCRPDECVCAASSAAVPDVLPLPLTPISRKIRYLSFAAGDAGRTQAVRVTFQNVPAPYAHWNGTRLWVQQPQRYCENAGQKTVPSPNSPPNYGCGPSGGISPPWFWAAELGSDPSWADWTTYGVVHVWSEGVIPNGQYNVQVIDDTCPAMEEGDFSTALTLAQSRWADLVKDCTTSPCGPPDNNTGIVDVTAVLDKWKNLPGNVQKVRADVEGAPSGDARIPNRGIDITDVTVCLGAFVGQTYPPPGYPAPGNPPSCGP